MIFELFEIQMIGATFISDYADLFMAPFHVFAILLKSIRLTQNNRKNIFEIL